jgi:cytochrome c oxidase subunit 2
MSGVLRNVERLALAVAAEHPRFDETVDDRRQRVHQQHGEDNQLDTDDDIFTVDDLHVEVDQVYHFLLESRDVLHSFSIPVFRLKQDAIPGRSISGWFEATQTGEYDLQCAEICGIGHGVMAARIHIESSDTHAAWVAAASEATAQ